MTERNFSNTSWTSSDDAVSHFDNPAIATMLDKYAVIDNFEDPAVIILRMWLYCDKNVGNSSPKQMWTEE